SLVQDIVMPIVGKLVGGVDFTNLFINLGEGEFASLAEAEKAGAPLVKYGVFINTALDFVIIAFAIFLAIKAINKMKRETPPAPEEPKPDPEDIVLLREIRDSLKRN
ncbi:MAG: large conductance mechanosensitive channel protein MscL, partial [Planctomycetaceae bacterium]|nr:large conductance mechanosensitive channel protein MscL [Planctomycetaceae bacterium]